MDNDYCEDCRANGDDYYTNEDGERSALAICAILLMRWMIMREAV